MKSDIEKCVNAKIDGDVITISCKLNNWAVGGVEAVKVFKEARRYFNQYQSDGAYDDLLGKSLESVKVTHDILGRHAQGDPDAGTYGYMQRQITAQADEISRLRNAIMGTLAENSHLSDGDDCTLIKLKRAVSL